MTYSYGDRVRIHSEASLILARVIRPLVKNRYKVLTDEGELLITSRLTYIGRPKYDRSFPLETYS